MDTHEGTSLYEEKEVYGFKFIDSKQSIGICGNGISNKLTYHKFLIQKWNLQSGDGWRQLTPEDGELTKESRIREIRLSGLTGSPGK